MNSLQFFLNQIAKEIDKNNNIKYLNNHIHFVRIEK